jgi:hypothetical protein
MNIKLEFAKYAAELYFQGYTAEEAIEKAKEKYREVK